MLVVNLSPHLQAHRSLLVGIKGVLECFGLDCISWSVWVYSVSSCVWGVGVEGRRDRIFPGISMLGFEPVMMKKSGSGALSSSWPYNGGEYTSGSCVDISREDWGMYRAWNL
jgi:hypothetical protein